MEAIPIRVVPSGSPQDRERRFAKAMELAASYLIKKEDEQTRDRNAKPKRGPS